MQKAYLFFAIIFFCVFIFGMATSIFFIVLYKNRLVKRRLMISSQLETWIMEVILDESTAGGKFPVPHHVGKLLEDKLAKKVLLRSLVKVSKSLSGIAASNIETLYNQLNLHEISLARVGDRQWHTKAKGIQELAQMNRHDKQEVLYSLTNDADAMVRMEAQTAMVRLMGFEGLRFVENLRYPLSEWHQLNLLHLLAHQPIGAKQGMAAWLRADNASVVQFALKLIAEQHATEFYDDVVFCLKNEHTIVRMQAVLCLAQIPSAAAATILKKQYTIEPDQNVRLGIIAGLRQTGSYSDLAFLDSLQYADDVDIRLAAKRTILHLQSHFAM